MKTTVSIYQTNVESQKTIDFPFTFDLQGNIDLRKLSFAIAKRFNNLAKIAIKHKTYFKRSKPVHFELWNDSQIFSTDTAQAKKLGLLIRATKQGKLVSTEAMADLIYDILEFNNSLELQSNEIEA